MSCYFVDKEHIDVLVAAALAVRLDVPCKAIGSSGVGYTTILTPEDMQALGRALWSENLRSVTHRYRLDRNDANDQVLSERAGYVAALNAYRANWRVQVKSMIGVLKALDAFEYQSCDHPEWEASPARVVCDRLRYAIISRLPGYADAPWCITADNVRQIAIA
jgi:hypothetical protein